jgi:glutathione S-transferase
LTESIAIVEYLTDKFPAAGLGPAIGDPRRGPYLTWLAYYAGVIEPVVSIGFAGLAEHPMLQRTYRGRAEIDARVLAALRASPYLLGDRFTAADLILASVAQWSRDALPKGDPVDGWLSRVNSRPALARAMAKDKG